MERRTGRNPGNPSSRGYPTWFIIPEPLAQIVVDAINNLPRDGQPFDRLWHCLNEFMGAALAATPQEISRLGVPLPFRPKMRPRPIDDTEEERRV